MNASTGSNVSILELAAARERRTRWRSLLLTLIPAFFAVLLLWQAATLAQNMAGELLRKQAELVELQAQLGAAREDLTAYPAGAGSCPNKYRGRAANADRLAAAGRSQPGSPGGAAGPNMMTCNRITRRCRMPTGVLLPCRDHEVAQNYGDMAGFRLARGWIGQDSRDFSPLAGARNDSLVIVTSERR